MVPKSYRTFPEEEQVLKKCKKKFVTWLVQRPIHTSFFIILFSAVLSPIFLVSVLAPTALICISLEFFATPGGVLIAYTFLAKAALFAGLFSVLFLIGLVVMTIFSLIQAYRSRFRTYRQT